jgi:hypothetical protein
MTHHCAFRQCAQLPTNHPCRYAFALTAFPDDEAANIASFSDVKSIESADTTNSVISFTTNVPNTQFPSHSPPPRPPRMWVTFYPRFDFDSDCADLTVPRTDSLLEVVEGAFHHAEVVGVFTPGGPHDLQLSAEGMPSLVAHLKAEIQGAFESGTCASLLRPANRIVIAL